MTATNDKWVRDLFEYEIGHRVMVTPIGSAGVVAQRCDRGGGAVDYQVVYWHNGDRRVEWLLPHEITAAGAPRAQKPLDGSANITGVATGSRNDPPSESVTSGSLPSSNNPPGTNWYPGRIPHEAG